MSLALATATARARAAQSVAVPTDWALEADRLLACIQRQGPVPSWASVAAKDDAFEAQHPRDGHGQFTFADFQAAGGTVERALPRAARRRLWQTLRDNPAPYLSAFHRGYRAARDAVLGAKEAIDDLGRSLYVRAFVAAMHVDQTYQHFEHRLKRFGVEPDHLFEHAAIELPHLAHWVLHSVHESGAGAFLGAKADWVEDAHPRGVTGAGTNAGSFAPKEGASGGGARNTAPG